MPPLTNLKLQFFNRNCFDATAANGRDVTPTHCAVPGSVFPRRVSTASTGDGATGQQPR